VHGTNHVLAKQVTDDLEGRSQGDVIEVSIDGNVIYGRT
jgi:FKBP-type peptidyl-prolyl cis-trans isomerase SlyD